MSPPESGKTDITVEPFAVVMRILMVGAGSAAVTCLRADRWLGMGSVVVLFWGNIRIAFVDEAGAGVGVTGRVDARGCRALQTLAKCPTLLQW